MPIALLVSMLLGHGDWQMRDLVEQLSDLSGLSSQSAALVVAALAILLIVFGSIALIVATFSKWAHTLENDDSSRLLPTLVEDVLDLDLQRVYRRALMLDDQVAAHFDTLAEPTGTELGRRARQILVGLQARRFAARRAQPDATETSPEKTDKNKTGEPPVKGARLKEVTAVIEEALDLLPSGSGPSETAKAARLLEELSTRLEPPGDDRPRSTPAG
jgi:hypothetical protein